MTSVEVARKSSPGKKRPMKFGLLVRIVVSLGLAAFVYTTIDRKGLLVAIRGIHLSTVITLVALYTVGQLLSAVKWRIFVREAGIECSLVTLMRAYFLGMFVNVFGFGTVGGDLARSVALQPTKGRRAAALATVVADRVHGLGVLLTIGTIAALLVRPPVFGVFLMPLILGGVCGVAALLGLWWFGPAVMLKVIPEHHKLREAANRISGAFPRGKVPFFSATAISFLFHNVQLLMHLVIAKELAPQLSASYLYSTVPYVNIVASLPVSIMNGLGVREAMYRLLLVPGGIADESAVAIGAVWLFTVTLVSAFGILFVSSDMKQSAQQAAIEDQEPTPNAAPQTPPATKIAVGS